MTIKSFTVAVRSHSATFGNEHQFRDVPVFWDQFYSQSLYERLGFTEGDYRLDHGVSILNGDASDLYDEHNQRRGLDFDYLTEVSCNLSV